MAIKTLTCAVVPRDTLTIDHETGHVRISIKLASAIQTCSIYLTASDVRGLRKALKLASRLAEDYSEVGNA